MNTRRSFLATMLALPLAAKSLYASKPKPKLHPYRVYKKIPSVDLRSYQKSVIDDAKVYYRGIAESRVAAGQALYFGADGKVYPAPQFRTGESKL